MAQNSDPLAQALGVAQEPVEATTEAVGDSAGQAGENVPLDPMEALDQTRGAVEILIEQLNGMWEGLISLLPSMVIAIIVLFLTALVVRIAVKIVGKATGKTNMRPDLQQLVKTGVRVAVWLAGLLASLTILLPGLTPASIVASLGIGAVAIGFAFQDIFENFMAGILIMIREKMRIGDYIECEGTEGRVEHIALRETHIRKLDKELTIVPNSMLFKNPVRILTDVQKRRHEIIAGVSYDTDLDKAQQVIREAVAKCDNVDTNEPVDVFAREFNSSSVDFTVRWWSGSQPRDMHESRDQVVRSIKRELDAAGIEIPFPYITHTFKEPVPMASNGAGSDSE